MFALFKAQPISNKNDIFITKAMKKCDTSPLRKCIQEREYHYKRYMKKKKKTPHGLESAVNSKYAGKFLNLLFGNLNNHVLFF